MSGWRRIESAPENEWILITGGEPEGNWIRDLSPMVVAKYTTEDKCWNFAFYDGGYVGEYEGATQWRPLPDLPVVDTPAD